MITLHFCEYNRFNNDYDTIFRPGGTGDYLFLLFKFPMKIYQGDKILITRDNACLLFPPGEPQHYQAVHRFCNSYLHFSSDEKIEERYQIPAGIPFYPGHSQEIDLLIGQLQQEYLSASLYKQDYIHALAVQMFVSISRSLSQQAVQREDTERLYPLFQSLRLEMLANCQEDWSIERLCRRLNLEKSQFYVYYHRFFSTTPKNDLLQVRLDKAKNLLSNEALQVGEAARLCGFHNMAHFARSFRKYCGCSPREYSRRPQK